MLFVGITGGVGAGKSEILGFLRAHYNSRVLLTDEIAHDLMEPGTACYDKLKHIFAGEQVYLQDGHFDRPALAKVIFSDDSKRDELNAIVHPAVKEEVKRIAKEERKAGNIDLLVVEAALLIEEKYNEICDELWYIYTSEENRRARLKASRGYSDEKIDGIFASQLKEDAFREHCRVVIDNNGTTQEAFAQIAQALKQKL